VLSNCAPRTSTNIEAGFGEITSNMKYGKSKMTKFINGVIVMIVIIVSTTMVS